MCYFDWDDLGQLVNRAVVIDRDRIAADCVRGFGFLANLTDEERVLAKDRDEREHAVWDRLRMAVAKVLGLVFRVRLGSLKQWHVQALDFL